MPRRGLWNWLGERPQRAALVLGLCALVFAVPGIGAMDGLGHADEHFYLSVAADTYDTGHVAPTHDGDYVFQKPPLVFWVARLGMGLLGRTGAAARLPGALAAALLVAAGTLFTAEVAGAALAPLAGAFLLGSLGVARFDRELMLDLPLAVCLGWALWAAARAVREPERLDSRAAVLAGFLSAACLGIKGPIGIAVLGLTLLLALARERRLQLLRNPRFWIGVACGLCVSAPWYVWAIATHPQQFWDFHIAEQYFSRFQTDHGQSRFNLLWGTLLYAAPFWPFAICALFKRGTQIRWPWIVGWLVAFYGIFLLPKEHGLHYPLLVLIPLATLAALATPPLWLRLSVSAALLAGAAALLVTLSFPEVPRVAAVVAAALALGAALAFSLNTPSRWALGGALTGAAANLAVAALGPALGRPLVSPEAAALGQHQPVAIFWEHPGPYRLAAGWGAQAHEVWGDGALRDAIDRGELILLVDHDRHGASPELLTRLTPVAEWRRTRPYLSVTDVWGAWKSHDLDALGERSGLYRAASK